MSLSNLINQPCTLTLVTDSGEVDEYGDATTTETEVATVCHVQQRTRKEPGDAGELSDTNWVGFFLPDETVNTASKLTTGSQDFEFVGSPWYVTDPRNSVHHIEASLRIAA